VEVTEWSGMALTDAGKRVLEGLGMKATVESNGMTLYHGQTSKLHQKELLNVLENKIQQLMHETSQQTAE
jgi:hypothetical protein